ncbi:MAG: DUF2061 domain-containing protein [Syntrophobacterales bacterium]|nr:MAG: DUF2061 domain-containing protein [Syntrophobacterales bacterium]
MLESKKRSFVKSITWRILAVLILAVVAYVITKDPFATTVITVITQAIKFVAYYAHERCWGLVTWGYEPKVNVMQRLRDLGYID